jgi:hypothetical protein
MLVVNILALILYSATDFCMQFDLSYPTPRHLSSNTGRVCKTNHECSFATFPINEDVEHGG